MTPMPESVSNTMFAVQEDIALHNVNAQIAAASQELKEFPILNHDLNTSNTQIGQDQFKHSFNPNYIEAPATAVTTTSTFASLFDQVNKVIESEISALPQPLQGMLRQNIKDDNEGAKELEAFFAQAGSPEAGYTALQEAHQNIALAPDPLSQLRETIYFYAELYVANTLPPKTPDTAPSKGLPQSSKTSPTQTPIKTAIGTAVSETASTASVSGPTAANLQISPLITGALNALGSTEKGLAKEIASSNTSGYGSYLNAMMSALHTATTALQEAQVGDAQVSRNFAQQLQTLAQTQLAQANAAAAAEAQAQAEQAAATAEAQKSKWTSLGILIGSIILAVVSIVATVASAGATGAAAGASVALAEGATEATVSAFSTGAVEAGWTVGSTVSVAGDLAGLSLAIANYSSSAFNNALSEGFNNMVSWLESKIGMQPGTTAGLILGITLLSFIILKRIKTVSPFAKVAKTITTSAVTNLGIPLMAMSNVYGTIASAIAKLSAPNDQDKQNTINIIMNIFLMVVTLWAASGVLEKNAAFLGKGIARISKGEGYQMIDEGVLAARNFSPKSSAKQFLAEKVLSTKQFFGIAPRTAAKGASVKGAGANIQIQVKKQPNPAKTPTPEERAVTDGKAKLKQSIDKVNNIKAEIKKEKTDLENKTKNMTSKQKREDPGVQKQKSHIFGLESSLKSAEKEVSNASLNVVNLEAKLLAASSLTPLESAKEEVENIEKNIKEVERDLETAKQNLMTAESRLVAANKLDQSDPVNVKEVADAKQAVDDAEKQVKNLNDQLSKLQTDQQNAEMQVQQIEQDSSNLLKARIQNFTQTLEFFNRLFQSGCGFYNAYIQFQISNLKKQIALSQQQSLDYQAQQDLTQAIMDKITSDQSAYQDAASDIGTLLQQVTETGNTILSTLQSSASSIFKTNQKS